MEELNLGYVFLGYVFLLGILITYVIIKEKNKTNELEKYRLQKLQEERKKEERKREERIREEREEKRKKEERKKEIQDKLRREQEKQRAEEQRLQREKEELEQKLADEEKARQKQIQHKKNLEEQNRVFEKWCIENGYSTKTVNLDSLYIAGNQQFFSFSNFVFKNAKPNVKLNNWIKTIDDKVLSNYNKFLPILKLSLKVNDLQRIKDYSSSNGKTKLIFDFHGCFLNDAKQYLSKLLQINLSEEIHIECIHGFNNGTSIKNYIENDLNNPKIKLIRNVIGNEGRTVIVLKKST